MPCLGSGPIVNTLFSLLNQRLTEDLHRTSWETHNNLPKVYTNKEAKNKNYVCICENPVKSARRVPSNVLHRNDDGSRHCGRHGKARPLLVEGI